MLDFLQISLKDIIDILLMATVIFYAFRLLRGSQAMRIFIAIVLIYVLYIILSAFEMKLISSFLGALLDMGLIALIIIFQPEIRRFLASFGSRYRRKGLNTRWLNRLLGRQETVESVENINEICKACEEMSQSKCGALIVIKRYDSLGFIKETGDKIDAQISKRLLMNLFFKNSPLHDGAVVIEGGRVAAARCTLPITERDLPASFGMRHKAAIGISENCDAQVIVVSEETGHICFAQEGQWKIINYISDLKLELQKNV